MTARRQVIGKVSIAAVLAFGLCVAQGAPAGADDFDQNPFSGLSCNCHKATPADAPAPLGEVHRGLREGYTAWLPGLPAVTR